MEIKEFNTPVVFFDGVCNLCNSTVQFIIRHDRNRIFLFCSLQSKKTEEIFNKLNFNFSKPETIILLDRNKLYSGSTAILKILRKMNCPYQIFFILIIIPKPFREIVYRYIAKRRYKWFGKRENCMLPDDELKNRFID